MPYESLDPAELQLRAYIDSITRNAFSINTTIDAFSYDGTAICFVRRVPNSPTIEFYSISTTATANTASLDASTTVSIPIIRGIYKWNSQYYILTDTQFTRLSALSRLETLAGGGTINAGFKTDYGKNLSFVNLTDLCFDPNDQSFFFTDTAQNNIYKYTTDGFIVPVCTGTTNIATTFEDGEVASTSVYIPSPYGLTIGPDSTLYATSNIYNQVYALRKTYTDAGELYYMITVLAGLSTAPGAIQNGETAKYSKPNNPRYIRYGKDGKLYFLNNRPNGTTGIAKLSLEQYVSYYKGATGAIQNPPIQVIGNNTVEGNVITISPTMNAISTKFFAMHMAADEDGNVYFPDPNTGRVYKMDLNNQLTILCTIPKAFTIALYNNSILYVGTESTTSSDLYAIPLSNPSGYKQIPGNFGSIRCLAIKKSGILFMGVGKYNMHSYAMNIGWLMYKVLIYDSKPFGVRFMSSTVQGTVYKNINTSILSGIDIYNALKYTYSSTLLFTNNSIYYKMILVPAAGSLPEYIRFEKYVNGNWNTTDYTDFPDSTDMYIYIQNERDIQQVPSMLNSMCLDSNDTLYMITSDANIVSAKITESVASSLVGSMFIIQSITLSFYTLPSTPSGFPFGIEYIPAESSLLISYYSPVAQLYKYNLSTSSASLFMGLQRTGYSIHGSIPSAATLLSPAGLCRDVKGNIFVFDCYDRVNPTTRSSILIKIPSKFFFIQDYVYPLIGNGLEATATEEGLALSCKFRSINSIATDIYGNVYFTSMDLHVIYKYDAATERVSVIAGTGVAGFSGDGGPSRNAALNTPVYIQVTNSQAVYVYEAINKRIRRLTLQADGKYIINTVVSNINSMFNFVLDIYENIIYCNGSSNLYIINQMGLSSSIPILNINVLWLYTSGSQLYYLGQSYSSASDRKVYSISYPYINSIPTIVSQTLSNPALPFSIDSDETVYYFTGAKNEIRKATKTTDETYIGNPNTQSFSDGIIPTAGIKDNQYRLNALVNGVGAITIDNFSRILFSDDKGSRIRCVPTGIQMNECFINTRYILIEAASPGKKFSFTQFDIRDTNNSILLQKPIPTPVSNYPIIDLGSTKGVSYIRCRSSTAETIGSKVYLLNANNEILSVRILTNACTKTAGETLVYAVPWANSCAISDYVSINKNCGVPGILGISITHPTIPNLMDYFSEIRILSRRYDTTTKEYKIDIDYARALPIVFQSPKEIICLFCMRSINMDASLTGGISIKLFENTTLQGQPVLEKQIQTPNPNNTFFEFVDFRCVVADFGCSSLDTLYKLGAGLDRIRYIRIQNPQSGSEFKVARVAAISAESGADMAYKRPAYTPSSAEYYSLTDIGAQTFTTTEAWVEIDLGFAVPLESILIYPPTGTAYTYSVECYSETRSRISMPTTDMNPWDTRVSRIRVQNSGYNETAPYLQTNGINYLRSGDSSYTAISASNVRSCTALSYYSGINQDTVLSTGFYHSNLFIQSEYLEFTLNTPQFLSGIQFKNRLDCCQKRQYGAQLLLLNSAGRILQRNCLMGLNTGDKIEEFTINLPNVVKYHFPTNKKGIPGVRYVRYSNTSTTAGQIQISQLIVYDVNGTNVARNKTATWSSIESNPNVSGSAPVDGTQHPFTNKVFRSASSLSSEFYRIDLGTNYEIDSVIYYNCTTNPSWSTGAKIELLDANSNLLSSQMLDGTLLRESLDFRFGTNKITRARYIRFETPGFLNTGLDPDMDNSVPPRNTVSVSFKLSNLRIRDMYNRNVAIGKYVKAWNINATGAAFNTDNSIYNPIQSTTAFYETSAYPGSYWEIDLGQEYSLKSIQFTPDSTFGLKYRNTPILLFDEDHVPVKTYFLTPCNAPRAEYAVDLQVLPYIYGDINLDTQNSVVSYTPPSNPAIYRGRFVHIDSGSSGFNFQLLQVVVLDRNGANVALGKPTKATNGAGTSYLAVNGLATQSYTSGTGVNAYWEVDLGRIYDITSILLYGAQNVASVSILAEQRETSLRPVWSISPAITNMVAKRVLLSWTTNYTPFVMPRIGIGRKARYVRLFKDAQTSQGLILSQIVIQDSFGRNIAFRKTVAHNAVQTSVAGNDPSVLVDGIYESRDNTWYISNGTYFPNASWTYTGEVYIDIDLGDEYWITDITIYVSKVWMFSGNWARNVLIELRDTYQNKVGTPFTTSARIDDFTFKIQTQKETTYCPPGSILEGTNCVTSCAPGETDMNGRCYSACDATQGQYLDPSRSQEYCYSCPTYTDIQMGPPMRCKDKCENNPTIGNMVNYDTNNCISKCDTGDIESGLDCITGPYDYNSTKVAVLNGMTVLWNAWVNADLRAILSNGLGFSSSQSTTGVAITSATYDSLNAENMAKQIVTHTRTPELKQIREPTAISRNSYAKTIIPQTTPSSNNFETVAYSGFSLRHEKIYDWSQPVQASRDTYFKRDDTNPAYVIGRYLAETFNLTGTGAQIAGPIWPLPAPSQLSCPAGFSINPDATADNDHKCITTQPANSVIIGYQYYLDCPAGFTINPVNPSKCINYCGLGWTANPANPSSCIYNCPDGYVSFEGDSTKCATDCTRQLDPQGKSMITNPWLKENDPTNYKFCITQKPSGYTDYNYARVLTTGTPENWFDASRVAYYAWISPSWFGFTQSYTIVNGNRILKSVASNTYKDEYTNCQSMISGYNYVKDCGNTLQTRFNIVVDNIIMNRNNINNIFEAEFTIDRFRRLFYKERTLLQKPDTWVSIIKERPSITIEYSRNI